MGCPTTNRDAAAQAVMRAMAARMPEAQVYIGEVDPAEAGVPRSKDGHYTQAEKDRIWQLVQQAAQR